MNQPLVSICVPTYNHAAFIGDALTSALEQDYDTLEVVVADDGSTDGTFDVVREFRARYRGGRLVVLPSGPNTGIEGIVRNYNRALHACHGKYVAFLEGDDIYLPGKIAKQVEWLEKDDKRVLCGHDFEVFDSETGKPLFLASERFPLRQGKGAGSAVRYNGPFGTVATMVRASTAPEWGFENRLRLVLDWKFWIDCLAGGGLFGYVDGVLARYRRHPQSVTALNRVDECVHRASFGDLLVTVSLVEASYPNLLRDCRYARARLFHSEGVHRLQRGDLLGARIYLRRALREHLLSSWKAPAWLVLASVPKGVGAALLRRLGRADG